MDLTIPGTPHFTIYRREIRLLSQHFPVSCRVRLGPVYQVPATTMERRLWQR